MYVCMYLDVERPTAAGVLLMSNGAPRLATATPTADYNSNYTVQGQRQDGADYFPAPGPKRSEGALARLLVTYY